MKPILKFGASVLALLAFTASPSKAVNHVWVDNDSSWFTAGNWSPATVPTLADNVFINNGGTARVNGNGNTAQARNITLGSVAGDDGTIRVVNDNILSTLMSGGNGDLRVGDGGTGTLIVRDTGEVDIQGRMVVGRQTNSSGVVDVSSSGGLAGLATLDNAIIGGDGMGTMDVHDGGSVYTGFLTTANAFVGDTANGNGSVTVRGEDGGGVSSQWHVSNNLAVGNAGTGNLEVHNGGYVTAGNNMIIGRGTGSVGTVLVEGLGAVSGNSSQLDVGFISGNGNLGVGGDGNVGGQGTLTIRNSGIVNVANNMVVWGPNGMGGGRSELGVDSTYTLNVGGALTFDGGRLNIIGDGVDFVNNVIVDNFPGPDLNGMHVNVSDGNSATFSGDINGNGQVVKNGTGTLTITSGIGNFYTGGTTVNNGTLVIAEFFSLGDFGPNNDLTLNNGTFRTVTDSPLVYEVWHDFNANGGTLVVQTGSGATAVNNDEMLVANAANLTTNSNLFAHEVPGGFFNNGDRITVIQTNAGVNGTFAQGEGDLVPNDFVGLIQPFVTYSDPATVDFVFGFAATFQSVARTPNQIATAAALDRAVAAGCIVNATNILGNIPVLSLKQAYDLIAPEELASIYEASFAQQMVNSLNLQHRMDDIRWGSTGFCADGFVIQDNHGYTKNDGKSVQDKNPVEQVAPPNYRWGTFITGHGELTKVGNESLNDPGADGYQLNNAGFTMGVDYRVTDHWAIGLSGGYSHTTGDLVNNGRLNTDGGKIGLYSTYYTGGFYVDASATGGWNQYDTRRNAYLGVETGSTDGAEFDGMIAVGYDWTRGCWKVGPYADFEYNYVEFNSFSEDDRPNSNTSSLIPLHFPDQNESAYRTNLGFRIAHEQVMKPGEGLTVVPEVRAAWRHDFGDNSYGITSNFIGCDDQFTVHGPWIGSDSAVVDIGLTAYCTQQLSAYVFYQGQFGRDNYNNNAISGGMRFAF